MWGCVLPASAVICGWLKLEACLLPGLVPARVQGSPSPCMLEEALCLYDVSTVSCPVLSAAKEADWRSF